MRCYPAAGDPPQRTNSLDLGRLFGENDGKKGQGGLELTAHTSITRAARLPELIADRLLKVTPELRSVEAKPLRFVTYSITETHNASYKYAFWATSDRAVGGVPKHENMFVFMVAHARKERREKRRLGSKYTKRFGAYGRDALNGYIVPLLSCANNHDLALVNTFFSTPNGGVSHTFNGRGNKCIDCILTGQLDRNLVRNVMVYLQPPFLLILDHNIMSAPAKFIGYFIRNRQMRTSAEQPVDRRRMLTDPQLRQHVTIAVGRHLRENPPGDSSVSGGEAAFASTIMRTAEYVIPPQT